MIKKKTTYTKKTSATNKRKKQPKMTKSTVRGGKKANPRKASSSGSCNVVRKKKSW